MCLAKPIVTFVLEATLSMQQTFCCQAKCDVVQLVCLATLQSCVKPWVTSLAAHEKEQNSSVSNKVLCSTYVPRSYRLRRLKDLYSVVNTKGN